MHFSILYDQEARFYVFCQHTFFQHLSTADLSRNCIRQISARAFCNLSNLTTMDVSYNKIPTFELDHKCHLPKLQDFNISGNEHLDLLNLQPALQKMTQLRSLSMADMTNLPLNMFTSLSNLEALNVSGTSLGNDTGLLLEPLEKLKVTFSTI